MHEILTRRQKERAAATANLVVAAMVRLECEHGTAAVIETLRLILSALPSEEQRREIMQALANME